jgi:hypothetical protein
MPETPYTEMEPEPQYKTCLRATAKVLGGLLLAWVLVLSLVQFLMYEWATMNCSAGTLQDYNFPGGGSNGNHTADYNLVPTDSLIIEQEPRWLGSSFINVPANQDGLSQGASTGVYYRYWGPLFWTIIYQDIMSKTTFVGRSQPSALGGSHKIWRCDGKGPVYVVTEGTHVVMNAIRSMFGMYTSRVYSIYEDETLVALSARAGGAEQSHKQMIFRKPDSDIPFASSFLKLRDFHGKFDEWFVQVDQDSPLPNYVPNFVTARMGFETAGYKTHKEAPGQMLELLDEMPPAAATAKSIVSQTEVVQHV